jgi:hypothetical protein
MVFRGGRCASEGNTPLLRVLGCLGALVVALGCHFVELCAGSWRCCNVVVEFQRARDPMSQASRVGESR